MNKDYARQYAMVAYGCIMRQDFGRSYDQCFEMGSEISERVIESLSQRVWTDRLFLLRALASKEHLPTCIYKQAVAAGKEAVQ